MSAIFYRYRDKNQGVRSEPFRVWEGSPVLVTVYDMPKKNQVTGKNKHCEPRAALHKLHIEEERILNISKDCSCKEGAYADTFEFTHYSTPVNVCNCTVNISYENPILLITIPGIYFFNMNDPNAIGIFTMTLQHIAVETARTTRWENYV